MPFHYNYSMEQVPEIEVSKANVQIMKECVDVLANHVAGMATYINRVQPLVT